MRKLYIVFIALFSFTSFSNLQAQAPTCASNVSPVNNATNINPYPSVTLNWTAVAGATSYDVYISAKTPPKQLSGSTTTNSFNIQDLFYSTVYYWYVVPKNSFGAAVGCSSNVTSFTTTAAPAPPANDNCSGATSISNVPLTGSTVGATQSQPASLCSGYTGNADDDVWYKYTATSTGPTVINMTGTSNFDGVLEAFSGDCSSLTSLTCSDTTQNGGSEQITINAVAGTTYMLRIYGFYGTLSSTGNFSISLVTTSPLPITLLNFTGEKKDNRNLLQWSTGTELNNLGFEVEYSNNGSDFNKLAFISSKAANGNSTSVLSYEFSDANNFNGNAYYRLKQVDKDGRASFSKIIFLKGEKNSKISFSNIYPNPAHNTLFVTIASAVNDNINIEIRDIAGKVVLHQPSAVINGNNKLPVNVASLPGGSYFIKAISRSGEQSPVSKFVKQ